MKKKRKPNRYFTHVQPRLETIVAWRRRGMIEKEICENLGVGVSTFAVYKNDHPELVEVLRTGKADADAQVENALFKIACGYEYEEVKTIAMASVDKNGNPNMEKSTVVRVETVKKFIVPNVTAQLAYLQNRCSDRWRDRRKPIEVTGPNGEPIKTYEENSGDNIVNIFQNDPEGLKQVLENALAGVNSDLTNNRGPYSTFSSSGVRSQE